MAVRAQACSGNLSRHRRFPQGRNVRPQKPTAPSGSVSRQQHAEGKGRFSDRELSQFLSISRGSVFEIETQVLIAVDLGCLTAPHNDAVMKRCAEVGRFLNGLIKAVRKPAA
jgi:hypothetical protein